MLAKDPKNRLDLKENVDSGVYVKDLTSFIARSPRLIRLVSGSGGRGWFLFRILSDSDDAVASSDRERISAHDVVAATASTRRGAAATPRCDRTRVTLRPRRRLVERRAAQVKSSHEIDQVMQAGKKAEGRRDGHERRVAGPMPFLRSLWSACDSTGSVRQGEHITVGQAEFSGLSR